jgi:hypothetical protein
MNHTLILSFALIATPAFGQTMYKCPNAAGVVNFQQMPCSLQGGGETVPVKAIPAGAGSGLSDNAKAYMEERDQYRAEQAQADAEESQRQEALQIERGKVRAAQEQAAAQRATARAIWATGQRR